MTKDEALKLALEALDCIYSPLHVREINKVGAAMTAIKEALAQPEQKRPQNCGTGYCSCIECVMEPEQEPVAYTGNGTAGREADVRPTGFFFQADKPQPEQEPVAHLWECLGRWSAYLANNGMQAECAPPSWLVDAIKKATAPPQRKPLARERLVAMADIPRGVQTFDDWVELFGREIEAAHDITGDKNDERLSHDRHSERSWMEH